MGWTFSTSDDGTGMRPLILRDDRLPQVVWLDEYWKDATEVTHSEYARFEAETGRKAPYNLPDGAISADLANYPVYNMEWVDASACYGWHGKCLPTEAEWGARRGRPPGGQDLFLGAMTSRTGRGRATRRRKGRPW